MRLGYGIIEHLDIRLNDIHMDLRHFALLASLALPPAAWAQQSIQPGEGSLQPLYSRLTEIREQQLALTRTIQDPKAGPQQKEQAKTAYQTLEAEKLRIQKEVSQSQWMQKSGLVNPGTSSPSPVPAPGQQ